MRPLYALLLVILVGVGVFFGAVYVASESGEVVTLQTRDANGNMHSTRLWVVDYDGSEWVRTGHGKKGWFRRVEADPHVDVERGGTTSARIAVPVRDAATRKAVNEVFAQKYGAADWIVALSGDASKRIPVRLDPVPR